jgi:hypothetical protein
MEYNHNNNLLNKEANENMKPIIDMERNISKEKLMNNIRLRKESIYTQSEFFQEENPSVNKESIIAGMILVFIYFSVIIYSLLYMLTPDRNANLIFEGNLSSEYFNNSIYNSNNDFYKVDAIRIREDMIIIDISRNFLYENNTDSRNNLLINLIYSNMKNINKVVISNNYISKEISNGMNIYQYYKINDFPFWLILFNKENDAKINITSEYLNNISFDN